jgi:hypothetical protein
MSVRVATRERSTDAQLAPLNIRHNIESGCAGCSHEAVSLGLIAGRAARRLDGAAV